MHSTNHMIAFVYTFSSSIDIFYQVLKPQPYEIKKSTLFPWEFAYYTPKKIQS